jgi:flagella basal body P-ring formation protein FlgA
MATSNQDILHQVDGIISERGLQYGDPAESLTAIAEIWTTLLRNQLAPGQRLSASDVGLLMASLKIVRQSNTHKRDNLVDAIGYLTIVSRLEERT